MTERQRRPGAGDDGGLDYDRESTTGIPRWVKIVGIIVAVVVLLVIVMMLIGGVGGHGPGRHGGNPAGAPSFDVTASHAPPAGVHG